MCLIKKSSYGGLNRRLRLLWRRLQGGFSGMALRRYEYSVSEVDEEDMDAATMIPGDVKEGHFAVVAVKGGKSKRFVVELSYLSNPAFLRLLEEAKEEFGFQQKGPLAIPCQPEEVQKILEEEKKSDR